MFELLMDKHIVFSDYIRENFSLSVGSINVYESHDELAFADDEGYLHDSLEGIKLSENFSLVFVISSNLLTSMNTKYLGFDYAYFQRFHKSAETLLNQKLYRSFFESLKDIWSVLISDNIHFINWNFFPQNTSKVVVQINIEGFETVEYLRIVYPKSFIDKWIMTLEVLEGADTDSFDTVLQLISSIDSLQLANYLMANESTEFIKLFLEMIDTQKSAKIFDHIDNFTKSEMRAITHPIPPIPAQLKVELLTNVIMKIDA